MKPPLLLLADDDEDSIEAYSLFFRSRGYDVESAPDGPAALFKALALQPDLILLDVGLPLMHGLEVLRRLRADGVPRIPVMILTGHALPEVASAARRDGADDIMIKPCEPAELCARVEMLLQGAFPSAEEPREEDDPDSGRILFPRPRYRSRAGTMAAALPAAWPCPLRTEELVQAAAVLTSRAYALCRQAALLHARARDIRAGVEMPGRWAPRATS
jgi:DNA-binding response OmpR family regulator